MQSQDLWDNCGGNDSNTHETSTLSHSKKKETSSQNARQSKAEVYHLTENHDGLTLAGALRQLKNASWNEAKKWISKRQTQVNGNLCLDEARRVNDGDVVKLHAQPLAKPVETKDIRIAHLDEHLIVLEKPAGVTTVRHFNERKISTRRKQLQPTVEEMLPPLLAKILKLRWPPLPPKGMNRGKRHTNQTRGKQTPGHIHNAKKLPPELQVFPVHRLDRDTSGLMLFARTKFAEQKLVSMFRRHTIQRQYTAFCVGTIEPQEIRSMLVRDRGDGSRGSLREGEESDQPSAEAITHILKSDAIADEKYSKLLCKLETGRTHQIRIHLAEAGHPICGDKIYFKSADGTVTKDSSNAPRHALHSHSLEFTHPATGEHLKFHMPLPKDLVDWVKKVDPKPEQ